MKNLTLLLTIIICLVVASCNNHQENNQSVNLSTPKKDTLKKIENCFQLVLTKNITVPNTSVQHFYKKYQKDFKFGITSSFRKNKNNTTVFDDFTGKKLVLKVFRPIGNLAGSDYLAFINHKHGICPLGQGLAIAWLTSKDDLANLPNTYEGKSKSFIGMTAEIYDTYTSLHNPDIYLLDYNSKGWSINVPNSIIFSNPYLIMFETVEADNIHKENLKQRVYQGVYDPDDPTGEKAEMMEENIALFGAEGNKY